MKPTSRKRKVAAVKEEATRLCSQIVRATRGPYCEAGCGRLAKDHAHIVGRTFAHTRTDETNGLALCGTCHADFDRWHDFRTDLLERLGLTEHYVDLKAKALAGVNQKFDWYDELDRLRAIAVQIEGVA
jgi:hypothetical protein